jgi:hypothetical protein
MRIVVKSIGQGDSFIIDTEKDGKDTQRGYGQETFTDKGWRISYEVVDDV